MKFQVCYYFVLSVRDSYWVYPYFSMSLSLSLIVTPSLCLPPTLSVSLFVTSSLTQFLSLYIDISLSLTLCVCTSVTLCLTLCLRSPPKLRFWQIWQDGSYFYFYSIGSFKKVLQRHIVHRMLHSNQNKTLFYTFTVSILGSCGSPKYNVPGLTFM